MAIASMSAESSQSRSKLHASLTRKIDKLKKQIDAERVAFVQEKLKENKWRAESYKTQLLSLVMTRTKASSTCNNDLGNLLSSRIENPLHLTSGQDQEVVISITVMLPVVEKIPRYTTWIFLNRNRRMTEDDSAMAKRPISYNQIGGVARTSNEEEIAEPSEEKHEFSVAEKRIIRMVCQNYEPSEEILQILTQHVGGTTSEIHEVFNMLKKEDEEKLNQNVSVPAEVEHDMSMLLDKSLVTCLDTFDTLFCRRCLVFDCSLHGYAQPIITPTERLEYPLESQEDGQPCSDQCYRQSQAAMKYPERDGSCNINNARTSGECADAGTSICQWKPLEVDLYLKGREIFGSNSCLITRNLLFGLKTCLQVHSFMYDGGADVPQISSSASDDNRRTGLDHKDQEMASRSQIVRRKGKAKKLKHSSKSAGSPSTLRRIAGGKDELEKHYTPCQCNSMCGKECPCLKNLALCEKYCGCSKSCKSRFRGCHCTNSQCRSQRCPCFAARRECDPDICRNCWVRCGDGSLGESSSRRGVGEGECSNMRLLLGQHQRILLGKSDVVGWGAFLKNSVKKDDYLGEYTGELISHEEAATRGSDYDEKDSSFLFDVNDEHVLDALRKGNKLKFANHSPSPNCYAKIITVAGDHHVAIFSKKPIQAGQELFYDYCYKSDAAPEWYRKPNDPKAGSSASPRGQAKKHQPHQ